jgi:hypothetical protein
VHSDDLSTGTPSNPTGVQILKQDAHDVSPPLTELVKRSVPQLFERVHEAEPVRAIPHLRTRPAEQVVDPVVQTVLGGPNIPSTTVNFEGMGTGLAGFTVQSAPPDTDGDIGPNHYVQIVNSGVTIFSRAGAKLLGPMNTNTFFSGFGGACATTNDGDGVVRYDRIADRWVIAQFSVNGGSGPFFQCVAVSTSPDPTGTYNRYQFSYGTTGFNDYPKMGLWPDGYYTTFNIFTGNTFSGGKVCAYDRAKMLTGGAATQQCFDAGSAFGGLLASDLDGPTLPPTGSPNFIGAIDTTAIDFWKMHVDFTTPANSTFVGPTTIPIAAYSPLCGGGTCVVQPGTTQQLDSLADRAMNRFVYRNYGNHEALLMSHSVTAGAGGGVRFYELRSPATTPTIFQQGTYAPDAAFRWMPSMAFDKDGNIAMGFSTSSSTINPSIRYTGRLVGDVLGTMGQGEATLVAGTGSQTGSNLSRWGDYSSMNIDPTDDCTFWYTQEYMGASGAFNWHTRIGAFKLPTCGAILDQPTPPPCTTQDIDCDGIPDAVEQTLLETYRPYLRFSIDHGSGETFRPTDVGLYLNTSDIHSSESQDNDTILSRQALMQNPLLLLFISKDGQFSNIETCPAKTNFYVNPNNDAGRPGNPWDEVLAAKNIGLYGHVTPICLGSSNQYDRTKIVTASDCASLVLFYKIEYWQFFGFNSNDIIFNAGDHEGDWDTIQIIYRPGVTLDSGQISTVLYYAHGKEMAFDMSSQIGSSLMENGSVLELQGNQYNMPVPDLSETGAEAAARNHVLRLFKDPSTGQFTHPLVFVERGGHEFWPSPFWGYIGTQKHGGDDTEHSYLTETPPNLGEVEHPMSEYSLTDEILHYNGYWGAYSVSIPPWLNTSPPPGPTLHYEWAWPWTSSIRPILQGLEK